MWAPGYEYLHEKINTSKGEYLLEHSANIIIIYRDLNVIVKQYSTSAKDVEREFKVGLLVNDYNSPYLVKTLGYFSALQDGETHHHIVTDYVEGTELAALESQHCNQLLYMQILYIIRHLQEQMEFTHYDLHECNIIVKVNGENSIKEFRFGGESHTLETPYDIKFIDLMMAHVKGVSSMYYHASVSMNMCPGVFDPVVDYGMLLSDIAYRRQDNVIVNNSKTREFLDNNLLISNTLNGTMGYPAMTKFCPIQCIKFIYRTWACVESTITKTRAEVNREAAIAILEEFDIRELQGMTPEAYVDKYLYLQAQAKTTIMDKYIKMLGEACVYEKKEQMAQRQSTAAEFFEEFMDLIKRIFPE